MSSGFSRLQPSLAQIVFEILVKNKFLMQKDVVLICIYSTYMKRISHLKLMEKVNAFEKNGRRFISFQIPNESNLPKKFRFLAGILEFYIFLSNVVDVSLFLYKMFQGCCNFVSY